MLRAVRRGWVGGGRGTLVQHLTAAADMYEDWQEFMKDNAAATSLQECTYEGC